MKHTASMMSAMTAGNRTVQNNIDVTDLEAGTYTIQFSILSIQPSPNIQIPIPPIVKAVVTWKIEGQQQRREISVVSGAAISGVCQSVDVKLHDLSQDDVPYDYQVQVTLSKGIRANTQQPPQLSRGKFESIPAQDEFRFAVPQDAGVISFFTYIDASSLAVDDARISMTDAVNNTVAVIAPAPNATQWIPLIPGTTNVALQNFHATFGMFGNLIWGIDG